MLNFKYIRAALVAAAIAALTLSGGASPKLIQHNSENAAVVDADASESISISPETMDAPSTFYSVRRDLRRCVSPLCGGYFVKRVNTPSTRCANGRFMGECYVAEIDWNGQPQSDSSRMLVRGQLVAKRFGSFGNLGELRLSESWKSISDKETVGTFYLVRDRGVRCITFPCPTHHEAKLNSSFSRNIAGVYLDGADLRQSNESILSGALTGPDGVIIIGSNAVVTGPGGRLFELRGTQAYVRAKTNGSSREPDTGSMKPCIKTGCSSQVCNDHNVITTCEWRPEYACYQKAECKRQSNGNCGFTKTPELTACLAAVARP